MKIIKATNIIKHINKISILVLCVLSCIFLMACSDKKTYRLPGSTDEKIIENQIDALISAIEDADTASIRNMFSKDALSEIDDMDEFKDNIDILIETFPDWDGEYEDLDIREEAHTSYKALNWYAYGADIDFEADGEEYQLHLVMIYNTQDKDLLGLRVIQICDADCSDYQTPHFNRRPGMKTDAGVYCWDYGTK